VELQYELTVDDVMLFHRRNLWHRWRAAGYRVMAIGVVSIVLVFLLGRSQRDVGSGRSWPLFVLPILVAVLGALAIGVTALLGLLNARSIRATLTAGAFSGTFGQRTLALSADGIIERTEMQETRRAWGLFEPVEERSGLLAFRERNVAPGTTVLGADVKALIIPRRAFRDEEHLRAFLDEARRLKAQADAAQAGRERSAAPPR
jgi:hypothetical protein